MIINTQYFKIGIHVRKNKSNKSAEDENCDYEKIQLAACDCLNLKKSLKLFNLKNELKHSCILKVTYLYVELLCS